MQLATYAVGMAIALLLGQALTLLESAGLGPARLALGQDVHVVFARNLAYPQVRTGLAGVEVDELRRRLEGRAQVLAFRVYEAQVVEGGRKRFATVLGLGREGDAGGEWLFGGVAPRRGVCLAPSGDEKGLLVDGKPCEVAASLSGAWWLGRSLSWTRWVANDLLRGACWAQLATCAGLLCLGVVAQAQYEKAIAPRDGWKLEGLSAVPMRVADLESAAARWGPELQEIVARRMGDPQDVGYIWPLPMESGPAIEIERVPGRYYWANWAGLKRLNLGCTDLSAIPEGRLRQGILLSEKLAAAIGSERTGPGRKVRFFDKQLEVLGTCRETGANAYFAAYVFEPANLANVILEEREADALVPGTVSGLWEVDGPAVALAHRWREMWLPEADKAALVDSLGALALGVAFAGLLATALLLVGKCQQEMALRHALGGSGLGLIPGEGWRTLRMVGAANGLVLLLAGLAMAARREWHPAALLACGAAMMLEAALVSSFFVAAAARLRGGGVAVMELLRAPSSGGRSAWN